MIVLSFCRSRTRRPAQWLRGHATVPVALCSTPAHEPMMPTLLIPAARLDTDLSRVCLDTYQAEILIACFAFGHDHPNSVAMPRLAVNLLAASSQHEGNRVFKAFNDFGVREAVSNSNSLPCARHDNSHDFESRHIRGRPTSWHMD